MLARALARQTPTLSQPAARLLSMAQQISGASGANGTSTNGANGTPAVAPATPAQSTTASSASGVAAKLPSSTQGSALSALPKSHVFTSSLPADSRFPTPKSSHEAERSSLGPAMVKGALYTFVRPETKTNPELLAVSPAALRDVGLAPSETSTESFLALVSGNAIDWDPATQEGVYPWAQCYGGWQFGSWAGQLGDGRAISLFEATNPETQVRWEWQLKGGGRTPYSRFADGKAVLRSSIREFVVSEALAALGIPTTRALSLVLTPDTTVARERTEPGAIVCRFAQSWLRIGTFDLLRARGDRQNVRKLADYLAEQVYGGWDKLPQGAFPTDIEDEARAKLDAADAQQTAAGEDGTAAKKPTIESPMHVNRYLSLYRQVCIANARTVAAWQAYGFTNGVLNTDNTSLLGLSLDFGPFAFVDDFDPSYTPNHDDHSLRYSYRNQPSIVWWNLVRLGETLGELIGAGTGVDEARFANEGVDEDQIPEIIARAERAIQATGVEYQREFLAEYKRLMGRRLGLKEVKEGDFDSLFSEALDTMEAYALDFHHWFRRLSGVKVAELGDVDARKDVAARFLHAEGVSAPGESEEGARARIAAWLEAWAKRVREDWGDEADGKRLLDMAAANPNFVPRGWVLDEIIRRVEKEGDRDVLSTVMRMALDPFADSWDGKPEEQRWCADPPRPQRGIMCSCSS